MRPDPYTRPRPPAGVDAIDVRGVDKVYEGGLHALRNIDLTIRRGEIFALLGANGAGKSTLIGVICGLVTATSGTILVDGHDAVRDYRLARSRIGLVPQELHTDAFETVWNTVTFSRGLFGHPRDPGYIEQVLRDLSLWEKRHSPIKALSGGMKRRVLIAKALAHEPAILFLDEPTAGVDVELRRDMWMLVRRLRERGVTIILTTHYIEEAEDMADRIGVIHNGEILLVEEKETLMRRLGRKQLSIHLNAPLAEIPPELSDPSLGLADDGATLVYTFDGQEEDNGVADLLRRLLDRGVDFRDLRTSERSLEEIFVSLVQERAEERAGETI
jgi:ABC-2 type transport system ATP-binding protein